MSSLKPTDLPTLDLLTPNLTAFLAYCRTQRHYTDHTCVSYKRDICALHRFLQAHQLQLTAVTKPHCRQFLATRRKQDGVGNKTISRAISTYRTYWAFLQTRQLVTHNPWHALKKPRSERTLPSIIATQTMISFLESIPVTTPLGLRNKVICECLYGMGVRVAELVAIRMTDLDLSRGECRIIGKGNKERMVLFGDLTLDTIRAYIKQARPLISQTPSDYLIIHHTGAGLTTRSIQRIVKHLSSEQGIHPPLTPHTLRHCFASDLYRGGADLRLIQTLLGHDHLTTTELYTHVANEELALTLRQAHPHGLG